MESWQLALAACQQENPTKQWCVRAHLNTGWERTACDQE